MEISDLIIRFGTAREQQVKAIFSTLFIAGNRLQTLFDNDSPDVSLKQFMLLTMIRQAKEELTFTQLGKLMGCSRQNVKKLAAALQQKGFVKIQQNERDVRAAVILPSERMEPYFDQLASYHNAKLKELFLGYSDEELAQFFMLFMKIYDGIERLEMSSKQEGNIHA